MRVGKYLKQLAGESAIYGVSSTINVLLGVILMPLLTHVFTVTEYGVYTLVEGAFVLLTMLVVLGLDNASARWFYESDDWADRRRTIGSWFWCQLAASAGLAALLIGFAPAISALVTDSRDYALVVRLMGAVLPFQAVHRVFQNWLRYQRRAWAAVAFASSTAVATVVLVLYVVVVRRQGLAGFYAARLAAWAVAAAVAAFCLRGWISWKTFSPERLKTMLVFGLPFVPVAVGTWAMRYTDRYILKELCGSEEVGLFGAAFQIAMGVGVVVTAFTQAWGPFAFSLLQHRDSRRVYARVLDAYAFLGCGLCTAVALAAPLLVQILAPPGVLGRRLVRGVLGLRIPVQRRQRDRRHRDASGQVLHPRRSRRGDRLRDEHRTELAADPLLRPRRGSRGQHGGVVCEHGLPVRRQPTSLPHTLSLGPKSRLSGLRVRHHRGRPLARSRRGVDDLAPAGRTAPALHPVGDWLGIDSLACSRGTASIRFATTASATRRRPARRRRARSAGRGLFRAGGRAYRQNRERTDMKPVLKRIGKAVKQAELLRFVCVPREMACV